MAVPLGVGPRDHNKRGLRRRNLEQTQETAGRLSFDLFSYEVSSVLPGHWMVRTETYSS